MSRLAASILAGAMLLLAVFAARAADQPSATAIAAPPQTEDLILEIRLGKYVAADSFVAQFGDSVTYLPVAQFAEALEIGADLHLDRKQVSGKIGAKQIAWSVDAARGVLRRGGDEETLPAGSFYVASDDIYLDSRQFEKLWPVTIALRLNLLRLTVQSEEPLPIEERLAREEEHKRLRNQYVYPDFPQRPSAYQLWSIPQGDLQLSSQVDRAQQSSPQYYSALATGDLLYMTGRLFITGADVGSTPDIRFSLSRADSAGGVFGLPAMKQFAVGDITTPAFQNITNGRLERGVVASSFPLDLPSGYDRTVIEGDALPGWEAELYRNETLLDYQVIPAQGQYRFINVPLLIGTNILRVELYGPQGQRREEVKRLYVGAGVAAPGQGYWRFALSDANQTLFNMNQNESQLFGFTNEPRSGPVGSAEYLYGISQDWSIGGSIVRAPPNNATVPVSPDAHNYGSAILRTNQLGIFFTEQATISDSGGTAFDSVAQTAIGDYGVTGEYLRLSKFESEAIDFGPDALVERARIHLDGDFGPLPFMADPVNFAVEGVRDRFQSGRVDTSILHSLFLRFGRTYLSNSVSFAQNQVTGVTANTLQGLATGNLLLGKVTLRGQLQYEPQESFQLESFNGTAEYRWSPDMLFRATVDQTLVGRSVTGFGLSASRDFGSFLLGAGGRIATDGSLTVGLTLSVSFAGTPSGHLLTSSKPIADRGSLAARVFLDRNLNGIYDSGDELLPKATLDIEHRRDFLEDNVDGDIVRTGIEPYRRTNVSVNEASLTDPYMKPVNGASFVPRPGHMEPIDLPVVETAEAEGALQLADQNEPRPLSGIKIQLLDATGKVVQEATSAYDGYFYFSRLVPGHYSVAIDQSTSRAASYDYALPPAFDVAPGAIKTGLGITGQRRAP
ncbi:MAG TPA: SdrD B-like domain-containing protein [Stellaceae bacterium]